MKRNVILSIVLIGGLTAGTQVQAMDTANKILNGIVAITTKAVKMVLSAKSARTKMVNSKQNAIEILKTLPPESQDVVEQAFSSLSDGVEAALDPIEYLVELVETINEKIVTVVSAKSGDTLAKQLAPIKAQLVLIKEMIPSISKGMKQTEEQIKAEQDAINAEALKAANAPAAALIAPAKK